MTQTPIEMAREVVARTYPKGTLWRRRENALKGLNDNSDEVRAALAMHARLTAEHQAAVAELVDALDQTSKLVLREGMGMYDEVDRIAANDTLIAKHRAQDATSRPATTS